MRKLALLLIILFAMYGASHANAPQPTKEQAWTVEDSKAYALDLLNVETHKQFVCLAKLWGKESRWDPKAYNKVKVMGKNAGGIPQLLGMSPNTQPTLQIERGLAYIKYKYGTPCKAWAFHKRHRWY